MILAIDPGLVRTGFVLIREKDLKPMDRGILDPSDMYDKIRTIQAGFDLVIEKPVCTRFAGKDLSETAIVAGMFMSLAVRHARAGYLITRSKVKGQLIGRSKSGISTDSQIRLYLVNRFAPELVIEKKSVKGHHWFDGFAGDIWAAYALGVAHSDLKLKSSNGDAAAKKYLNEAMFKWRAI